ncbi:MAG: TonB-dependent receptor [Bacteroidota bacterium]
MLKSPIVKVGFLFLVLYFFSVGIGYGQETCTFTFSGKVVDQEGSEGLPFATVYIETTKQYAQCDEKGCFKIDGLCQGIYKITCEHIGCEARSIEVNIQSDLTKDISLEQDIETLQSVEIQAKKEFRPHSQASAQVSADDLRKEGGSTLGGSIEQVSGVTLLQTGPNIQKPVIHGMHSNRIQILQNGIRQEDQQWGEEHAPQIDPNIAESVTVVKGASSVQYGAGAIGGVILIEPDALPFGDSISGRVNLGGMSNGRGFNGGGVLQGGIPNKPAWAWRVQGNYTQRGDSEAPDYFLTNTGAKTLNYSAGLGFQKGRVGLDLFYSRFDQELGILRAAHIGNLTDLENAIASGEPIIAEDFSYEIDRPRQEVDHQLIKLKGFWNTPNGGKLSVLYGLQINNRQEFDRRRLSTDFRPSLDLELFTNSLDIDYAHPLWKRWKGNFGVNLSAQVNFNVPGTGIKPLIPDYEKETVGLYWIERYITNNWEFEIGARYEYQHILVKTFENGNLIKPVHNFHQFAANLGFVYHVNDGLDFRTNFSTGIRPPAVNELYSQGLHHGTAALEFGDRNLNGEQSYKWTNEVVLRKGRFDAQLVVFANYIDNFIFLIPEDDLQLTIRGAFPVFFYRQTDAFLIGSDWDLGWQANPFLRLEAQYSMIRGRDLTLLDDDLIFLSPDRMRGRVEINPGGKWSKLELGAQVSHVRSQGRVPEGIDFALPPDAYTLVGLDAGMEFPLNRGRAIDLWLQVDNLFNERYRDYLNRLRYYADDPGRNVRLNIQITF